MTTQNPDTTAKPASVGAPPGATPPAPAAGADSAAEPTLKERSAELRQIAKQEEAKLRNREKERAERVALEARVRDAEAKAAKLAELEERLGKDPLGILNERGVKARDIAERVVKEGTPDAKLEELSAKYQRLVEEREAERKAMEAKVAEEQRRAQYEAARKQLHTTFEGMKEKLPILSRLCTTPARIEREYMSAWNAIQSDPEASQYTYTDAEIFQAMEDQKALDRDAFLDGSDADVLEKVLTSKRASATSTEKASPGGVRQASENASSSSAKTLTNGQAAARASTEDDEFARRKGETIQQWDRRTAPLYAKKLQEARRG